MALTLPCLVTVSLSCSSCILNVSFSLTTFLYRPAYSCTVRSSSSILCCMRRCAANEFTLESAVELLLGLTSLGWLAPLRAVGAGAALDLVREAEEGRCCRLRCCMSSRGDSGRGSEVAERGELLGLRATALDFPGLAAFLVVAVGFILVDISTPPPKRLEVELLWAGPPALRSRLDGRAVEMLLRADWLALVLALLLRP